AVQKPYTIYPLGDTAITLDFGSVIDTATNKQVLKLFQKLKQLSLPFISDVVPAYASLTVYYDVVKVRQHIDGDTTAAKAIEALVERTYASLIENVNERTQYIRVPVCYSTNYAPDINALANAKGLTIEQVIQLHVSQTYRVYMIGFMPGFAYMGEVSEQLAIPRKAQPCLHVEAGSVGIAGRQTGIYPQASPGGWQIIGRTPLTLFDPHLKTPALFKPGDEVQFYSITEDEFKSYKSRVA
ncbi:MAG TPA: 5-oxoprolinase subunit PxpB, partial [Flavisolibacter sp.]|nr:5-oxoprolinase subunit PxpB [Flavisolibacter sp.]